MRHRSLLWCWRRLYHLVCGRLRLGLRRRHSLKRLRWQAVRHISIPVAVFVHGTVVVRTMAVRAQVGPSISAIAVALRHRSVRCHAGGAIRYVVHHACEYHQTTHGDGGCWWCCVKVKYAGRPMNTALNLVSVASVPAQAVCAVPMGAVGVEGYTDEGPWDS